MSRQLGAQGEQEGGRDWGERWGPGSEIKIIEGKVVNQKWAEVRSVTD